MGKMRFSLTLCFLFAWLGLFAQPELIFPSGQPPLPPPPGGEDLRLDNIDPPNKEKIPEKLSELEEEKEEEDKKKRRKKSAQDEEQQKRKDILALERQLDLPQAKIWGQQFFRDQSLSLFTRSRDIKAPASYRLSVDDELMINVWGRAVFSANCLIDEEGFIDMSGAGVKIPRLYLKGMRFADAKKAIIARLSTHMDINGSQHAIELNFSRNISVNITGEVFNPGSYTIPATNTAFNALVASGGPAQMGSVREIRVVSPGKPDRILDIYRFALNPNVADEFFLQENDYIYVPLAKRVVQIDGAIRRPFFYELIQNEQLIELLDFAGGLQADAYSRNIQIKRYENNEEKIIDLDLSQILSQNRNFELLNGDIILVSPIKQAYSNYIRVTGAVKLPGEYEAIFGQTRLREVLDKAGIIQSAVMERIYVKRLREDLSIEYININVYDILRDANHPDNIILRPLDEIEVKYKSEYIDKYQVRIYGAVRKPGDYQYSANLSLADLLYMANGIRLEASNSVIEVSRMERQGNNSTRITFQVLNINDSLQVLNADNFLLEPFDQVFVRSSRDFLLPQNITIMGEVNFPGIYTLSSKQERVRDVLNRAGGMTEVAFLEGAKLSRKSDGMVLLDLRQWQDSSSVFNYILQEGDVITIPRVKDLVALAGVLNHPHIRDLEEINNLELELELAKAPDDLTRQEILTERKIKQKRQPHRINVPYHRGKRANFYVQKYGAGLNRKAGARKHLVYVRYANGLVRKTRNYVFFKTYPIVERGAMVYAEPRLKKPHQYRQREPFTWNHFNTIVQGVLSTIVSGLTAYFFIDRIF